MNQQILPTDEQAKFGQEACKVAQEGLQILRGLGGFFERALASVPEDLIGYLGGDWLRLRRLENIASLMGRTQARLQSLGVEDSQPASLTLALPILRGAADESREELQDLWARLLAAAMDPATKGKVRQGFASLLSKMDPPDALALSALYRWHDCISVNRRDWLSEQAEIRHLAGETGMEPEEFALSVDNLIRIDLVRQIENGAIIFISPSGIELVRLLCDERDLQTMTKPLEFIYKR